MQAANLVNLPRRLLYVRLCLPLLLSSGESSTSSGQVQIGQLGHGNDFLLYQFYGAWKLLMLLPIARPSRWKNRGQKGQVAAFLIVKRVCVEG
jgi:hypothetical protein